MEVRSEKRIGRSQSRFVYQSSYFAQFATIENRDKQPFWYPSAVHANPLSTLIGHFRASFRTTSSFDIIQLNRERIRFISNKVS